MIFYIHRSAFKPVKVLKLHQQMAETNMCFITLIGIYEPDNIGTTMMRHVLRWARHLKPLELCFFILYSFVWLTTKQFLYFSVSEPNTTCAIFVLPTKVIFASG